MQYPSDFSQEARTQIEAEKLKAERDLRKVQEAHPSRPFMESLPLRELYATEAGLYRYVGRVSLAFGREACALGQQGIWAVDQVRNETERFFREFHSQAYDENHPSMWGLRPRSWPEVRQWVRRLSPEWEQLDADLLAIAETAAIARASASAGLSRFDNVTSGVGSLPHVELSVRQETRSKEAGSSNVGVKAELAGTGQSDANWEDLARQFEEIQCEPEPLRAHWIAHVGSEDYGIWLLRPEGSHAHEARIVFSLLAAKAIEILGVPPLPIPQPEQYFPEWKLCREVEEDLERQAGKEVDLSEVVPHGLEKMDEDAADPCSRAWLELLRRESPSFGITTHGNLTIRGTKYPTLGGQIRHVARASAIICKRHAREAIRERLARAPNRRSTSVPVLAPEATLRFAVSETYTPSDPDHANAEPVSAAAAETTSSAPAIVALSPPQTNSGPKAEARDSTAPTAEQAAAAEALVGKENDVDVQHAAWYLRCSRGHILRLIRKKHLIATKTRPKRVTSESLKKYKWVAPPADSDTDET